MYELFIGLRYLRGRSFLSAITLISVASVAFGVAVLVIVLSVMTGFETYLTRKILGGHAHLVLEKEELRDWKAAQRTIEADPRVEAAAPFVSHEGMISSRFQVLGVIVKGIDPVLAPKVTELAKSVYVYLEEPWDLRVAGGLELLADPARLEKLSVQHMGSLHLLRDEKDGDTFEPLPSMPPRGERAGDGGAAERAPGSAPSSSAVAKAVKAAKAVIAATILGPQTASGSASAPSAGSTAKATASAAADEEAEDFPEDRPVKAQGPLPGILLGRELARQLKVSMGSVVHLVAPMGGAGPSGVVPKTRAYRVAAILYSEMYEFDTKFAYTTLDEAQKFFGDNDAVTGIEVKLKEHFAAKSIGEELASKLGAGFKAKDWSVMNKSLFSALTLEKIAMFTILCLIIVVAAFNIVSTLVMMVVEKGKEIAIIKSMGATDGGVMRIFLFEGLVIGGIGTLLGLCAGVGIALALGAYGIPLKAEVYYFTTLPVQVRPLDILAVALASLGISFLATLYPALAAARLRPVEALRYE